MVKNKTDWANDIPSFGDPCLNADEVTPDDNNDLTNNSRALYIGVTGDVEVTMVGNTNVVGTDATGLLFEAVPAGTILPIAVSRVRATDTTASGIIALY